MNDSKWAHAFLREPGRDDEIWACPLGVMIPAAPLQADLVRAIDLSVFPPVSIAEILENPA
ncbi:hypothetical protein [Kitasatospora purpeofusca]|uniref:hypothetical protein n=1 Tax=Kitasatospora purpeofusca TaxID=67352 RepID=UPI0036B91E64